MRLLHEDVYRDLLVVTKIRNDFAHSVRITSFEDVSIKSRVGSLHGMEILESLLKTYQADLQANPDNPDVRLKEQLVRFDLLSTRDTFKACLRMYIWKLVTSAKKVRDWIASQPEPAPEEGA